MEPAGHAGDDLQLLLDGRLPPERARAIEEHVAECGRCRRELEALRRVKTAVSEGLADVPVPDEVAARIARTLADEQASPNPGKPVYRRRIVGAAVGLAAAATLALLLARASGSPDAVTTAARDFAAHRTASLPLEIETGDAAILERFFIGAGIPFETRVFDLGMMGYRLVGGRVHRFEGRSAALFAYESAEARRLLCQMYRGSLSELPAQTETRTHDDIEFRVYRRDNLTLVFWQEGAVVCVLVSDGAPEEAVQLAYAKAVKL